MRYSKLLTQVVKGIWFVTIEEAIASHSVVKKLLDGDYSIEKDQSILSERKPLVAGIYGTSVSASTEKRFDSAPKGSVAVIPLKGTMLKYGTFCSYGTEEIGAEIRKAAQHKNIDAIVLDTDSGGGAVDAIAPIIDAIEDAQAAGKPVVSHADLCASAAIYAASSCNKIIASNSISSEFGSIGVMMSFRDFQKYYEKLGITEHVIYAPESNYKNLPFELAKKGEYEKIKTEQLSPLARKFQNHVKAQRKNLNTEVEGILNGKMFSAEDAKAYGLIDAIGNLSYAVQVAKDLASASVIEDYLNTKN